MIEVILSDLTGVLARAEADDPEAALVAARTLWEDHDECYYGQLRLSFLVDGSLLARNVSLVQISSQLARVTS